MIRELSLVFCSFSLLFRFVRSVSIVAHLPRFVNGFAYVLSPTSAEFLRSADRYAEALLVPVLPLQPSSGWFQIFVRDDWRERGSAEDVAPGAGQAVDGLCGQFIQFCFPAPHLESPAGELVPFEH